MGAPERREQAYSLGERAELSSPASSLRGIGDGGDSSPAPSCSLGGSLSSYETYLARTKPKTMLPRVFIGSVRWELNQLTTSELRAYARVVAKDKVAEFAGLPEEKIRPCLLRLLTDKVTWNVTHSQRLLTALKYGLIGYPILVFTSLLVLAIGNIDVRNIVMMEEDKRTTEMEAQESRFFEALGMLLALPPIGLVWGILGFFETSDPISKEKREEVLVNFAAMVERRNDERSGKADVETRAGEYRVLRSHCNVLGSLADCIEDKRCHWYAHRLPPKKKCGVAPELKLRLKTYSHPKKPYTTMGLMILLAAVAGMLGYVGYAAAYTPLARNVASNMIVGWELLKYLLNPDDIWNLITTLTRTRSFGFGFSCGMDHEEAKQVFKRQSLKFHPDKPGGDKATFIALRDAYNLWKKVCG